MATNNEKKNLTPKSQIMNINFFEDGLKLAQEFLATKTRENFYDFKAQDDDFAEVCYFVNKLSDAEVAGLRTLKAKYGEDFVQHLDEVFDDPDIIHDFTCGCEILDIDLDTVHHSYGVTLHELHPDGTVKSIPTKVVLSDDNYARLLAWHLWDEHLNMNLLRHRDEKLYNLILSETELYYTETENDCLMIRNPYLVTLDEAKEDSELIARI